MAAVHGNVGDSHWLPQVPCALLAMMNLKRHARHTFDLLAREARSVWRGQSLKPGDKDVMGSRIRRVQARKEGHQLHTPTAGPSTMLR